jgi:hypothetical protein
MHCFSTVCTDFHTDQMKNVIFYNDYNEKVVYLHGQQDDEAPIAEAYAELNNKVKMYCIDACTWARSMIRSAFQEASQNLTMSSRWVTKDCDELLVTVNDFLVSHKQFDVTSFLYACGDHIDIYCLPRQRYNVHKLTHVSCYFLLSCFFN